MSDRKKRTVVAAVLGLVLVGVMAVPAAAEGSFSSSFSGWLPGKSSRTWSDDNRDANSTLVTLGGCRAESNTAIRVTFRLQLTRETPWYTPDQNKGRKDFACSSRSVTGNWGRRSAGSYHFTLTHVNGQASSPYGKVRASTVRVSY
jgi:hypothetical protein